jgi:hypothetical protein
LQGEITFEDTPNATDISLDINWGTAYDYQLESTKSNFTHYYGVDGDIFIMQLVSAFSFVHVYFNTNLLLQSKSLFNPNQAGLKFD